MNAASAIRNARQRAGISKRELARRAHTSPAAVVEYESGRREPTLPTLDRLLRAAGSASRLTLQPLPPRVDPHASGARLAAVLELAEHLPTRAADSTLRFPPLALAPKGTPTEA